MYAVDIPKVGCCILGLILSVGSFGVEVKINTVKNISLPDPVSDVLTVVLEGTFGPGPKVVYYNDFRDEELYQSLSKDKAFVGTTDWNKSTIPPSVSLYKGQPGFYVIDPETDQTAIIYAQLGGTYEKIFLAYSVAVPDKSTAPMISEEEKWQIGSNWKLAWLLESAGAYANDSEFDMCAPTLVGDNSSLTGNSSKFLNLTGTVSIQGKVSSWWIWDEFNHIAVTLDGNAAVKTLTKGGFSVVNKKFKYVNFPTVSTATYSGPPPKVSQVNFPGWVRGSVEDKFQAIYTNIYIAGGENFLARIEITNSATYEQSTYRRVAYPLAWSGTEVKFDIYESEIQAALRENKEIYAHYFDENGKLHPISKRACLTCPVGPEEKE